MICFFPAIFQIFSLPLALDSLIIIHLGMNLPEFLLFQVQCASWTCRLMLSSKLKSSLSLFKYHVLFSFSFWDSHQMYDCMFKDILHVSKTIYFILFPFCSSNWIISINLFSVFLILSPGSSNELFSSTTEFFISVTIFSTPKHLFIFFILMFLFSYFCSLKKKIYFI